MTDAKEYLTKEKYEELGKELEYLKKTKRREVAEALEYAKSMGDLAENQEYQEARDMQAGVEDRIAKLENILKHAEIMGVHKGGTVTIGSTVVVKKLARATQLEKTLVMVTSTVTTPVGAEQLIQTPVEFINTSIAG